MTGLCKVAILTDLSLYLRAYTVTAAAAAEQQFFNIFLWRFDDDDSQRWY